LPQPSLETLLPSSQLSPLIVSSTPLPQVSSDLQSALQPSAPTELPSSQLSPVRSSTTPLPHDSSDKQLAAQPSPSTVLPSSQISPPLSTPSPHDSDRLASTSPRCAFGTWQAATIDKATSEKYSWKLFNYTWMGATPGEHTLVSRVTDATGLVQPTEKDLENKKTFLEDNSQYPRKIMV